MPAPAINDCDSLAGLRIKVKRSNGSLDWGCGIRVKPHIGGFCEKKEATALGRRCSALDIFPGFRHASRHDNAASDRFRHDSDPCGPGPAG
jgi:hypothetical protein